MATITHKYFGNIDTSSLGPWSQYDIDVNGNAVHLSLSGDKDNENTDYESLLDDFAEFCSDLSAQDNKAHKIIIESLKRDADFIEYFLEETPDLPAIKTLVANGFVDKSADEQATEFGDAMWLYYIDMSLADGEITMDYTIREEGAGYILVITLDSKGVLKNTTWDS